MVEPIRTARVVVTHAGVGSVMVSLANGKRPVVVPRRKAFAEAVDDHQLQLGRRFAEAGLVTLVEDPDGLGDALARDQRSAPIVPATSSLAADLSAFLDDRDPRGDGARMTTEPSRADSIGARVLSGIAWKAGSQVTLQITRMVVALVLARLLTPHDWGLAAMVIVFAGFTIVFTDNALGTALIQRRDLREEDKSTVFWVSAGARARSRRRRRRARGAAGGLLRRAGGSLALRRVLRRLRRQRARHDPAGAARPRDAVPTARAPPDRGDGRRRGDRHHDRARRVRRLGDRRPAARRGGRLDRRCSGC